MKTFESDLTLDITFASKVLTYVRNNPGEHEQGFYGQKTSCGTAACIAGRAVILDPRTIVFWNDMGSMRMTVIVNGGEYETDIETRAAELLGLAQHEAF